MFKLVCRCAALIVAVTGACAALTVLADEKEYSPKVHGPSKEGLTAIQRFQLPKGLRADLVAAEPLLANPVAFCLDEKGNIYVVETYRLHAGVTDNRNHPPAWTRDDLLCRTVADRVAMYRRHLGNKFDTYGVHHDRVRKLTDSDGDGVMDRATVFADGFKGPAEGIGSGVIARGGDVYFTCIPDLWLLRDADGDGKAEVRKSLHTGYGVHTAFIGHDLHGLAWGPDGKLYFSIGDRGLHVETGGRVVSNPDHGAVLRCDPDGGNLELVHVGLRNPQELAFDKYGNLFTCDNNADSGDQARWVHLVEGGDSGWRIGYQYLRGPGANLGPWNLEKLWHTSHPGEAAYRLPPLAHVGNGPSGLTHDPGATLLPEKYRDRFFLCDFRGGPGGSGVHAIALKPKGASFTVERPERFVWGVLATDCDFGPDGALYLSDWVDGWGLNGKGRVYKVHDPGRAKDPATAEVKRLLADGFAKRPADELARLLSRADMRVRREAQFALAERGDKATPVFAEVARGGKDQMARLHALWGLGQVGRKRAKGFTGAKVLADLTADRDAEVRAQAANVLGWVRPAGAAARLVPLLRDESPRVRFFAAQSLGKLADAAAVGPVLEMLRANADADVTLRHASVMALAGCADRDALLAAAKDDSASVRLAALLAMRRRAMPEVAHFLADADPALVLEAARAVNDVPIPAALPQLAALAGRTGLPDPVLYRVVNAQFQLGKKENAEALARLAARGGAAEGVRVEALKALGDWGSPSGLDRVVGIWRPVVARPAGDAAEALKPALGGILTGPDKVRAEGARLAAKFGIKEVGPALLELVADRKRSPQTRVETLRALETLRDERLPEAMKLALADDDPRLRAEGRRVLAKLDPVKALPELEKALEGGALAERQAAFATLGKMERREADRVLASWLDRLLEQKVPAEVRLDLLEAAAKRQNPEVKARLAKHEAARSKKDHLAAWRETLAGGDAEAGRRLFLEKSEVSCLRCHKVNGLGGEVGPDLTGIGGKQTREYLLESLVEPTKQIAKGYDTVVLVLTDGQQKSGIVKGEDRKQVQLMTPEGTLLTVPAADIEQRLRGKSAMPEDLTRHLSRAEVRDLVEFLSGLR